MTVPTRRDLPAGSDHEPPAADAGGRGRLPEWRPIETAPKDGTPVILLRNDFQVFKVSWGRDCEGHLHWCTAKGSCIGMIFVGWIPFDRDSAVERHRAAMSSSEPPHE